MAYFNFQFWSIYVSCSTNYKDAVEQTIEQIELTYRLIAKYPNDLKIATSPNGELILKSRRRHVKFY